MEEETVTITRKRYESLLDDEKWRITLESGGVDNWTYYHDALQEGGYFSEEEN